MSESPSANSRSPAEIRPRAFHHQDFPLEALLAAKARNNLRVGLAIPTLNEEATIGSIVRCARVHLMEDAPLLDEILVVDSGSTDNTMSLAGEAGASVHSASAILPGIPSPGGKGENLWKAAYLSTCDILCFVDGDIVNFAPHFVTGLVGPLLEYENLLFSKAFYERPLAPGGRLPDPGGGRVTEILVRPMFNLFFPELCGIIQPLSGEYAMRRPLFEQLEFPSGYGVEAAQLVDIARRFGLDVMAQVDLEQRVHRVRGTAELGRMACRILHALWRRLPQDHKPSAPEPVLEYQEMTWDGTAYRRATTALAETDLPALATLRGDASGS